VRRTLNHKMKRRRARRQALFLIGGCALVALLITLVFAFTPSTKKRVEVQGVKALPEEETADELEGEESPPLSLGLGGDVCFGLDVAPFIAGNGPGYPWSEITPLLESYDITAVNLEGPLCRSKYAHPEQPSFHVRGENSCASSMSAAGVDAVCLANDHIMDYGSQGLEETLNLLHGEEMDSFGAGASEQVAAEPLIRENEEGARIALLAFCDVAPPSYSATEDSPGLSEAALDRIQEMVGAAAEKASYVVVVMHWGDVGSKEITPRQRELAHACVGAGADLVAGGHPHVIQGIEVWEGVPIMYSLGNLVFFSQSEEGKGGLFAGCYFNEGRLTALELVPLRVEGARPASAVGEMAVSILQEVASASPGVEIEISPQGNKAYVKLTD
jgi:poly-gamma-glutamate capsule biosynthesis protein CapA/YwtB (metallophosphatase superfamily)